MTRYLGVRRLTAGLVVALVTVSPAKADTINVMGGTSANSLGDVTGTVSYSANTLTITLTNTSPLGNGPGTITAIVFNIASMDNTASASLSSFSSPSTPSDNWGDASNSTLQDGMFGPFEAGAELTTSPPTGIAIGDTITWVFTISASDRNSLSAADFVFNDAPNGAGMIIRFQSFDEPATAGSDFVTVVPLPAALPMGLAGLAGLALVRHRSRSARGKKPAMA